MVIRLGKPSIVVIRTAELSNDKMRCVSNIEKYCDGFAENVNTMTYVIIAGS